MKNYLMYAIESLAPNSDYVIFGDEYSGIEWRGPGLKPSEEEVNKYVTPKLIEISMQQGVFQVGETITGISDDWQIATNGNAASIKFRAAQPNHKFGAYNDPTLVYAVNPYSDTVGVSSSYSATSSILNVDTGSLQQEVLGTFQGFVGKNMILRGETSGAEAKVTDVRLISDEKGALIGSFFVPEAS